MLVCLKTSERGWGLRRLNEYSIKCLFLPCTNFNHKRLNCILIVFQVNLINYKTFVSWFKMNFLNKKIIGNYIRIAYHSSDGGNNALQLTGMPRYESITCTVYVGQEQTCITFMHYRVLFRADLLTEIQTFLGVIHETLWTSDIL